MRKSLLNPAARAIVCTLAVATIASATDAPVPEKPLQPLDFWVGHCWEGKFADGKATDRHCFEPMLDGHFVRDRHVVRGEKPDYSGETIYWFDAATKRIKYMYFNSIGGVSTGTVDAQGERLQFPSEEYKLGDGQVQTFRTSWDRDGTDGYIARTEQQAPGKWVEVWKVHFSRVANN
jgi:hypothetical protein